MAAGLIDFNGRDRRRDLLDQRQILFPVSFVGAINKFLQRRTAEPSCFPGSHCSVSSVILQFFVNKRLHKFASLIVSTFISKHFRTLTPSYFSQISPIGLHKNIM